MSRDLDVLTCLETDVTLSNKAPKLWGLVSLSENTSIPHDTLSVDIIVGLDISASMKIDDKFDHAKKAIRCILDRLDERHTFSLVAYNHEVTYIFPFMKCTSGNKSAILTHLECTTPHGSANFVTALKGITSMISRQIDLNQLMAIFFISAGDSISPLNPDTYSNVIRQFSPIKGCIFNVFDMGIDTHPNLGVHQESILYWISHRFRGVYHFVKDKISIIQTTNECMSAILNTKLRNLSVIIQCYDGCRMVQWTTQYSYTEKLPAKLYSFYIGPISSSESRSIVFQLSLRQLDTPHASHPLVCISTSYTLPNGKQETVSTKLTVLRMTGTVCPRKIPLTLKSHLDRIMASKAILISLQEDDIQKSNKILEETIDKISCDFMKKDLRACKNLKLLFRQKLETLQVLPFEESLSLQKTSPKIACSLVSSYLTERFLSLKRQLLVPEVSYSNYVDMGIDSKDEPKA